jgi:hypothetical protein
MPAKDFYHDTVRVALEKDGWLITHDPLYLRIGKYKTYIDLGAEKHLIAAEKGSEKIAVEIKSFIGQSDIDQFEDAFGQFLIYMTALAKKDPGRILYLAVPLEFYNRFFDDRFFVELAEQFKLRMLIFDEVKQSIVKWKK